MYTHTIMAQRKKNLHIARIRLGSTDAESATIQTETGLHSNEPLQA
jgi:hypothetical protein